MLAILLLSLFFNDPTTQAALTDQELIAFAESYNTCRHYHADALCGVLALQSAAQVAAETEIVKANAILKYYNNEIKKIQANPPPPKFFKGFAPEFGRVAYVEAAPVLQVVDNRYFLIQIAGIKVLFETSHGTANVADGQLINSDRPIAIVGTRKYTDALGATATAFVSRKVDIDRALQLLRAAEIAAIPPEKIPFEETEQSTKLKDEIKRAAAHAETIKAAVIAQFDATMEGRTLLAKLAELEKAKSQATGEKRLELAGQWMKIKQQLTGARLVAVDNDSAVREARNRLTRAKEALDQASQQYEAHPSTRPAKGR